MGSAVTLLSFITTCCEQKGVTARRYTNEGPHSSAHGVIRGARGVCFPS